MPLLAAITLRTADDWRRLVELVRPIAGPMASKGTPLRVTVAEKKAPRRLELNALMWVAVLEPIARQLCINGQWFSAEAIHEYLKRLHLPETCAKGVPKWVYEDDGRRLQMSTGDLDDDEFGEYLLAIQGHATSEWGVEFDDDR